MGYCCQENIKHIFEQGVGSKEYSAGILPIFNNDKPLKIKFVIFTRTIFLLQILIQLTKCWGKPLKQIREELKVSEKGSKTEREDLF